MDGPDVFLLEHLGEADRIRAAFDEHLPDVGLRVADDADDAPDGLADAGVVLTFRLTDEQLAAAQRLQWVQALNAGVDSYPQAELAERGIALTNSSGVHAEQMGQQVLGYMLVFERRIHEGIRQQHAGEWDRYSGGELGDDTLGVVGLGAIGSRVGEYGKQMGMDVIGTKRDPATAPECADACYPADELDAVLDRADYLVVACPLTEETEGLVDAAAFERLDEDAVVINIARGPIVDQSALVDALEAGEVRGAALDVTDPEPLPEDSPLRERRDVVVTPHMAGSSPYYFDRAVELFAENYEAYLAGEELRNRIV
ncbi:MAG: D-2-hydroxyacid dehydrogenase [Haloarculaceae archaeon]